MIIMVATVVAMNVPREEEIRYCVNNCNVCSGLTTRLGEGGIQELKMEIMRQIISLSAINTQELCRFVTSRQIFDGDISSTYGFDHSDLPVAIFPPLTQKSNSHFINQAIDLLTMMNLFYKLNDTRIQPEMSEQINLQDSSASLRFLSCSFKMLAQNQGFQISRHACRKSMTLLMRPQSRAQYSKWMFAVLKYNRKTYCELFNGLSLITDNKFDCERLPSITSICSNS